MRYYIDPAIWRDFYEGRYDKFRPLGEWAFGLFRRICETCGTVLYSDFVVDELLRYFDKVEIAKIFEIVSKKHLLEKVEINKDQLQEAARGCRVSKVPFGDYLHAILARDNDAIMIARDKHFWELQHIVDVKKPEDLI